MKLSNIYKEALKKYPIDPADLLIIINKTLGLSKEKFWTHGSSLMVREEDIKKINEYIGRLIENEPISYLTGEKEFYSENFYVDKAVLIPRPETELLLEILLEESDRSSNILEIGPGSGIISILVAKIKKARITSVEINKDALKVFKRNVQLHDVTHLVTPVYADLFPPEKKKFNIIVSNPPYLSEIAMKSIDPVVRDHEPVTALLGGEKGYEIIERIINRSPFHLTDGGMILLEIGYDQRDIVKNILEKRGFGNIRFYDDINGISRVVKAIYKSPL